MSKMYFFVRHSSDSEDNVVSGVNLYIGPFEEIRPALEQEDNSEWDIVGLPSDIDDDKLEEFANELHRFAHEFFTK